MQRAGDAGAGQRLARAELRAHRHQAGHLVLGEADLLAAVLGEGEVGDLEVLGRHAVRHAVLRSCRVRGGGAAGACPARRRASRRRAPRGARRRRGSASNHSSSAAASCRLAAQPQREADVAELDAVRLEQRAQGAQPLELRRAVEPVARGGPRRLHEAELLDVAQHPRRPPGGRRGLVDRQGCHRGQLYQDRVNLASPTAASLSRPCQGRRSSGARPVATGRSTDPPVRRTGATHSRSTRRGRQDRLGDLDEPHAPALADRQARSRSGHGHVVRRARAPVKPSRARPRPSPPHPVTAAAAPQHRPADARPPPQHPAARPSDVAGRVVTPAASDAAGAAEHGRRPQRSSPAAHARQVDR